MRLLLPLLLLAPLPAFAQTTPVVPVEKGTALPPPGTDEAAVLAPINALFAAFAAGDPAAVLTHAYPDGRVTAVGDGRVSQFSFTQFAQRVSPERRFVERIWNPAIEIDGDVALVWAPYDVRVDGKISNCGFDLFDLVRENGRWRVMNVTFSTRTTGCEGR
jgi:hypothetical protein